MTSASDTSPFERLNPEVQRWIRDQGWTGLRDIQEAAITTITSSDVDVVIMAGTASGKTEAAFLPLLTQAAEAGRGGLRVLYISPLKALINDQYRRLELMCDRLEMPLTRWHGDAPAAAKARLRREPAGVALITPESIEALLLRRPAEAERLFSGLQSIVVDELHAFLQGPRGLQLSSLLRRIDAVAARRPRRVGLSATLGNPAEACRWLDPAHPTRPVVLRSTTTGPSIKLQIRGYEQPPGLDGIDEIAEHGAQDALSRIADHLFTHLRGSNNLVFAGSRRTVEALADRLRQRSEHANVPEEFFPHHGSLSKDLRETLELRLKAGDLPTTAIATTTLELGIDLGSVKSVAQIGAPKSLASLKQRLGRSGRRGEPAILRIYVREKQLASDAGPLDRLRLGTVRAVAAVRLLLDNFVEPPVADPSTATVALHQTLATIASRGGVHPAAIYRALFGANSFLSIKPADYADLLREAAREGVDLLEQSPDGLLMLGPAGERLTEGRDFYAVFATDDEWRLVAGGRTLGTVPISNVLGVGALVGFAGRRWRVEAIDDRGKVLDVVPHRSGRLPKFEPVTGEAVHDRLSAAMRSVLGDSDAPPYLDPQASAFLKEARSAFKALGLDDRDIVEAGGDCYLLTWRGTAVNALLAILIRSSGFECEALDVGVGVTDCTPNELCTVLGSVAGFPPIEELGHFVANLRYAKLDDYISENLLRRLWCDRNREILVDAETTLRGLRLHN